MRAHVAPSSTSSGIFAAMKVTFIVLSRVQLRARDQSAVVRRAL